MQTSPTPRAGHNPSQQTPHARKSTHLWSRGPRQTWGAGFPFPSCQGILAIPLLALRARKNRPRLAPSLRFHLASHWLRDSGPRMDFVTVPPPSAGLRLAQGHLCSEPQLGGHKPGQCCSSSKPCQGFTQCSPLRLQCSFLTPHASSLTPLWVVFSPLLKPS